MLKKYFVDLHVHIGRTSDGAPVKVTAARSQTIPGVLREAAVNKGLDILGIVDVACPKLCAEVEEMIAEGALRELPGGGLRYADRLTLIPGAEIETTEANGKGAHWLAYFSDLATLRSFSNFYAKQVANPELSTQRCHLSAMEIYNQVEKCSGLFMPAHAFTPHKGVYGQCTNSIKSLLGDNNFKGLFALELGLSSDTVLADRLTELSSFTFLSNSDAHSLKNLGREYNLMLLAEPSFEELLKALHHLDGRQVLANYGLDPRLGKYHRSFCLSCERIADAAPPVSSCPFCGTTKIVKGVVDRIHEISDRDKADALPERPPYYYQVPLLFLPGVGPKTVSKLLENFDTEMNVLHVVSYQDLVKVVGEKLAKVIQDARQGKLALSAGGGGIYGKVVKEQGGAR